MSIFPLPVFESDADPHHRSALTDEEAYARLEAPKTMVVRFGKMKMIGEFQYGGDAKPGCGSKLIARTPRGTEIVEMLTTTCENAGCSKSVTRKELLGYIENSGGKDFPFHTNGRVLRVATVEELNMQAALEREALDHLKVCRRTVAEHGLQMRVVEVEPIFGGELITFYYTAEDRVDFRELLRDLAAEIKTRIELRQVGARDEARLTADYERCGQYCCCKSFLKVLKPISIKSAKVQKATLDPLKISGRCGRLMCCLRYEDQTYAELKANLPKRKTRVGTAEGPGIVIDTKILVQLALVRLEHDDREIAVPIEELMDPETCPRPGERQIEPPVDPLRGMPAEEVEEKLGDGASPGQRRKRRRRRQKKKEAEGKAPRTGAKPAGAKPAKPAGPKRDASQPPASGEKSDKSKRRRRRGGRRRNRGRGDGGGGGGGGGGGSGGGGD